MKKYIFTIILLSLFSFALFGQPPVCPKISIIEPSSAVIPGENLVYSIKLPNGFNPKELKYKWIVDKGVVVEGQATQAITVNTAGLGKSTVTAVVHITGLPNACRAQFKAKGVVRAAVPNCDPFGFGEIPVNGVRATLDSAFSDLKYSPSQVLYVVSYGRKEDIDKLHKLMKAYAKKHAAKHDFNDSRISYVRNYTDEEILTQFQYSCRSDDDVCCYRSESIVATCPTSITIAEPAVAVAPGENQTFIANVNGLDDDSKIGYVWSVNRGKIVEGQGTPTITVINSDFKRPTTATVTITGLPTECKDNSASASGISRCSAPKPRFIGEFGDIPNAKVNQRLKAYYSDLINDLNATAYIVNYGKPKGTKKREKLIRNFLVSNRKIDSSRLIFVRGGLEKTIRTRLWIVPAGADPSSVN